MVASRAARPAPALESQSALDGLGACSRGGNAPRPVRPQTLGGTAAATRFYPVPARYQEQEIAFQVLDIPEVVGNVSSRSL